MEKKIEKSHKKRFNRTILGTATMTYMIITSSLHKSKQVCRYRYTHRLYITLYVKYIFKNLTSSEHIKQEKDPISDNVQVAIFYGCSRVQEKGSRYFFNGSSRSKSRHRNSIKIQGRRCKMITRTRGHLVTYDHPIYESNSLDQTILSSVKQLRPTRSCR